MRTGTLLVGSLCLLATSCAAPPGGDLAQARQSCNQMYPERIGNYGPHANCVNAAVEQIAIPQSRHPDLVRVQERARSALSQSIDEQRTSPRDGQQVMANVDALINQAMRDRDAGDFAAADRRLAAIQEVLAQQGAGTTLQGTPGKTNLGSTNRGGAEEIPLRGESGTYRVPVAVNGLPPIEFVLDSGASVVSLPAEIVLTLLRTGTLSSSDFIGKTTLVLADGSTYQVSSLGYGNSKLENE
jgi:hypothetical protein